MKKIKFGEIPSMWTLVILLFLVSTGAGAKEKHITLKGISFTMPVIELPEIPDRELSIRDFGAKGDGITDNTRQINAAITHCASLGGGVVRIPEGTWMTGPIQLKSNIELHLDDQAIVVFSPDTDLYPVVKLSYEGRDDVRSMSPIYGVNLENVAITGGGVFDGSGHKWRPLKKSKTPETVWKETVASGGVYGKDKDIWFPGEGAKKGYYMKEDGNFDYQGIAEEIKQFLRPVMLSISYSKHVLIDGPVFRNSPAWCLHPQAVEHLVIRNITVKNPVWAANGDGIDIESCRNVLIEKNQIDAGDDAICIKSGRDENGRKRGLPSEKIVIRNCIVFNGHGGIVIGSEMSGGVKDVFVDHCTFSGTDTGLRFKSTRGRGGVVENIYINNINMSDILGEAILIDLYYQIKISQDKNEFFEMKPMKVDEGTPIFRDIVIQGLNCNNAGQAIRIFGLPEMRLQNITLNNISISSKVGAVFKQAEGLHLENINLNSKDTTGLRFQDCENVEVSKLTVPAEVLHIMELAGSRSGGITVSKSALPNKNVIVHEGVPENPVQFKD
jgi:polygalacturonase